jgi:hypothetical protein
VAISLAAVIDPRPVRTRTAQNKAEAASAEILTLARAVNEMAEARAEGQGALGAAQGGVAGE